MALCGYLRAITTALTLLIVLVLLHQSDGVFELILPMVVDSELFLLLIVHKESSKVDITDR